MYPEPPEAPQPLRVAFRVQRFLSPPQSQIPPCLANLRWTSLQPKSPPVLLACDMRTGTVTAVDLRDASSVPRVLAVLNNPCHVEPCDLDGDGSTDLIVADLGSQLADDHDRGQVVWLRSDPATGDYQKVVIAAGLGRVADAQPTDVNGDGDQDLIVAEFGMYRTGGIHCLRNVATRGTPPRFESEELDPRPGSIHVPIHDFNGNGRPDFVALVSQEHECVDLFLNQGQGRFVSQNLWAAPDLTFGSSGLQLVDLDRDGDLDILYSNGDSFDNMYVTPQHGVQWIENQGDLRFAYHRVADLLGTYRTLAGDLDGDGDLDILAVALLPRQLLPTHIADRPMTSIICLEQVTPGQFLRHHLELGSPYYSTCELADFDSDGDLDFAVGAQLANVDQLPYWLAVWWNQGLEQKTP